MNNDELLNFYLNDDNFDEKIIKIADDEDKTITSYMSRITSEARKQNKRDEFVNRRTYFKSKKSVKKYNEMINYYYIFIKHGSNKDNLYKYLKDNNINRAVYKSLLDTFINGYATDRQIDIYNEIREKGFSNTLNNRMKLSKIRSEEAFYNLIKLKLENKVVVDNINTNVQKFYNYVSKYIENYATEEEIFLFYNLNNKANNITINEQLAEKIFNLWVKYNYNIDKICEDYEKYGFTKEIISLYIYSYQINNNKKLYYEKKENNPKDLLNLFYELKGDISMLYTVCPNLGISLKEYAILIKKYTKENTNEYKKYIKYTSKIKQIKYNYKKNI